MRRLDQIVGAVAFSASMLVGALAAAAVVYELWRLGRAGGGW